MSFDTDIKADLDAIVAGEFQETIRYKPFGGAFVSISALVEDEREEIGFPVHGRTGPIFVTVSKTDVASVRERRDVVEWSGTEYTVSRIDSQDGAGWRLYCVR